MDLTSLISPLISLLETEEAQFAYVISGSIESDTIRDLHVANFMLNNYGNPNGIWIKEGQGRILYDKDGDSEPIDSL